MHASTTKTKEEEENWGVDKLLVGQHVTVEQIDLGAVFSMACKSRSASYAMEKRQRRATPRPRRHTGWGDRYGIFDCGSKSADRPQPWWRWGAWGCCKRDLTESWGEHGPWRRPCPSRPTKTVACVEAGVVGPGWESARGGVVGWPQQRPWAERESPLSNVIRDHH